MVEASELPISIVLVGVGSHVEVQNTKKNFAKLMDKKVGTLNVPLRSSLTKKYTARNCV